jgi:hypothetical protein
MRTYDMYVIGCIKLRYIYIYVCVCVLVGQGAYMLALWILCS